MSNPVLQIENPSDPRIRPYLEIRKGALQEAMGEGYFLAETFKVIRLAVRFEHEFASIFCTEEWLRELEANACLPPPEVPIYIGSKSLMESIVGFNLHQGLMAIVRRPKDAPLSELSGPVLVFNNVTNPENIGSMVRTAVGLGIKNFLSDSSSADPYLRRCVRVSMGNIFFAKVHRTRKLVDALSALKDRGYEILGSDMEGETTPLASFRFPENFALIIGSEVNGMTDDALKICDRVLNIPTSEEGFALNASHSAAILCYAAITQSR